MTKSALADWDGSTAGNNTDIGGIDLGEGTATISSMNNAMREMMKQIKAGVPYLSTTFQFSAGATPASNDGAALGTTSLMWSDVFLASGAVINFNNGDVTLTHSSNNVALAGGTLTLGSNLLMGDNEIQRPKFKDYGETVNAIGAIGGGTQDIDLESGNVVTGTVDTSETTFTFSNPSATGTACSFTLILTNGGSQTVNWPAAVDWADGTEPTLTTSGVDILTFLTLDAGTTWYGFVGGQAFA